MELLSIPVITALTAIFKTDNKKLTPFISIWIWIVLSMILTFQTWTPDYAQSIIDWLLAWLWASWLYSWWKAIYKK